MKILNKLIVGCLLTGGYFFLQQNAFAHDIKLDIAGVNQSIEKNIRHELSLEEIHWHTLSSIEQDQHLDELILLIKQSLEPFGYYSSKVSLEYQANEHLDRLVAQIELGPPIHVSTFNWSIKGAGKDDLSLNKLFETFPLTPGMVLDHASYEKAKREILATAYFSGYINAGFSVHEILIDLETHLADIHLTLDTEQIYSFGQSSFTDDYFDEAYLNRFITFEMGDTFTPDTLLTLQRHLTLSDQFSSVFIHQLPDENTAIIPIQIETERAKPNKYTFGIGYGTDTGARGQAGWDRRWINRRGHRFLMQGSLSEVYNQGYIEYQIPGKHPILDQITFSANAVEDEFSENESRYWQLGVSEKKQLAQWERTLSLYYRAENFSEFKNTKEKQEKLMLPSIELSKTTKDNLTNPSAGYALNFKVIGSIDTIISDASFTQFSAKMSWLKSFKEKHTLLLRTELGATAPDDISKLPLSMRFYAGGDNSIRGFGYRTLPRNRCLTNQKVSVGGAYLAIGSAEWSYKIRHPFGISVFVDMGNAFLGHHDPIEVGAGAGIRWHTPIGPLKIDLAKPLTSGAHSWRLHVTFGTGL